MREINKHVFGFSELFKYNFDDFIDLYDFEECEKIIEEDEELQAQNRKGSTGSDASGHLNMLG
jgi:hypothetical protein